MNQLDEVTAQIWAWQTLEHSLAPGGNAVTLTDEILDRGRQILKVIGPSLYLATERERRLIAAADGRPDRVVTLREIRPWIDPLALPDWLVMMPGTNGFAIDPDAPEAKLLIDWLRVARGLQG